MCSHCLGSSWSLVRSGRARRALLCHHWSLVGCYLSCVLLLFYWLVKVSDISVVMVTVLSCTWLMVPMGSWPVLPAYLCPGWLVQPVQRVGGTGKSPWQHLSYLHIVVCYVCAIFVFGHLSWHVSHCIFSAKATALDLGSG